MAKNPAKSKGPGPIASIKELSGLVDRDAGTVCRWLKRPDWPFPRRPPFKRDLVPKILRWVADNILQREAGPPTGVDDDENSLAGLKKKKLRTEIRKLIAQAEKDETALARERGQLLAADETEAEWARLGTLVRNGFQTLPSQLIPLALSHGLPREAAATYHDQIEQAVGAILRRLSRDDAPDADDDVPAEDPGRRNPTLPPELVPAGEAVPV